MKTKNDRTMKTTKLALTVAALLGSAALASATNYDISVVASGLHHPTGIVAANEHLVVFTQVPTPGMGGSMGGSNTVDALAVDTGWIFNISTGDPQPTDLALDNSNRLYWTCKSAGVIKTTDLHSPATALLTGLVQPNGVAADQRGNVYYTTLPTPGVPGTMGGTNTVDMFDGTNATVLRMGDPEPTDIAVDSASNLYWTCKSAGVILKRDAQGNVTKLLTSLYNPSGIAVDSQGGNLYFTEVPTPGMPGSMGGSNSVWHLDLTTTNLELIHSGDPDPEHVTVGRDGVVFWTCSTAGVIVEARPQLVLNAANVPAPGRFQFAFNSSYGVSYVVQRSTDLQNWTSFLAVNGSGGMETVTDTNAPGTGAGFYRVMLGL
jgi:hypothetical protein